MTPTPRQTDERTEIPRVIPPPFIRYLPHTRYRYIPDSEERPAYVDVVFPGWIDVRAFPDLADDTLPDQPLPESDGANPS